MTSAARRRTALFVPGLMGLVPMSVLAHPEGHGVGSAVAGFLHPFTGMDHLLAMIAVGLWAAQLGARAIRTLPIVFPFAMVGGALLAFSGTHLPAIEPMIAASVVLLGLLVAAGIRLPVGASALIVATFAIFHGYAHAAEGPPSEVFSYSAGFVLSTALLHVAGVIAGSAVGRSGMPYGRVVTGAAGGTIALAGTAILLM